MENNLPLVSVIVPLFNREKFLPQLFKTLQEQTYPFFELILIDDGSSDNTEEWLAENGKTLTQKVIYKKQQNAGPYAARNHGLSFAQGKYIAFQDSDDEWPNYHIGELVDILEKNNDIDWLFGNIERIDHATREVVEANNFTRFGDIHPFIIQQHECRADEVKVVTNEDAGTIAIKYAVPGSTQCALIRATAFKEHLFDESYRTAYDRFFAIKLVLLGFKFAFVEKVHQIYHIHDGHISTVNTSSPAKMERSARTIIRGYSELLPYCNNAKERKAIKLRLGEVSAWELSIALQDQGKYFASTAALFNAVKCAPFNIKYSKSMIFAIIKGLIPFKAFGNKNEV